ncbi:hypothetical protein [Brevundimonas sp. FT23042]|uniref:hypothetical protein n=1 Tax=Brevundimonas sp. FT23042 TaxID=3393749 RepID=UPI003B58A01A
MASDLPEMDPDDLDPRERDMGRRSGSPETGLWLAIGGVLMLGGLVYVVSALL